MLQDKQTAYDAEPSQQEIVRAMQDLAGSVRAMRARILATEPRTARTA